MAKARVGKPFKILVANLSGQLDVNGNPIKIRTGFEQQIINYPVAFPFKGNNNLMGIIEGDFTPSTAEITVADNDFTDPATLYIGDFELISGTHYTVGGTVNDTAANIQAAIDNLPGFSATVATNVVSIEGCLGPTGGEQVFKAVYSGSITNFTLDPATGFFLVGGPTAGGPTILP